MAVKDQPVSTEDPVAKAVAATYSTTLRGASFCCVDSAQDDSRDTMLRALYTCALLAADRAGGERNPHASGVWEDVFGRIEPVLSDAQALKEPTKKVAVKDFSARWLPGGPGSANPVDGDWPLRLSAGSLTVATLPSHTDRYPTTLLRLAVVSADDGTLEGSLDLTTVQTWSDGAGDSGQCIAYQIGRYTGRLTSRKLRRDTWSQIERKYSTADRIAALKKAPNFYSRPASNRGGTS